jgi:hypothetical protein
MPPTSPASKKLTSKRTTPASAALEPFKATPKPATRSAMNKTRIPTTITATTVTPVDIGTTDQLPASTIPPANTFSFASVPLPTDLHSHVEMPEWISNIYQALTTQRLEVEALKAQQVELTQLVAELHETRAVLAQANSLNVDLQNQINTLQAQIDQQPLAPNTTITHDDVDMTDQTQGTLASKHANPDYVPLPGQVPTMKASYWKMAQKGISTQHPAKTKPRRRPLTVEQRKIIARPFIPVTTSQGYQYISFFGRGKNPISSIRHTLRDLGVTVSRIIDIETSGQNVHSILVHNDYAQDVKDILALSSVKVVEFNPIAADVFKDPKYANLNDTDRAEQALAIHQQRLIRLIQRLPTPVKFEVARDFLSKEWITNAQHQQATIDAAKDHQTSSHKRNNTGNDNDNTEDNNKDENMDIESTTSQADGQAAPSV